MKSKEKLVDVTTFAAKFDATSMLKGIPYAHLLSSFYYDGKDPRFFKDFVFSRDCFKKLIQTIVDPYDLLPSLGIKHDEIERQKKEFFWCIHEQKGKYISKLNGPRPTQLCWRNGIIADVPDYSAFFELVFERIPQICFEQKEQIDHFTVMTMDTENGDPTVHESRICAYFPSLDGGTFSHVWIEFTRDLQSFKIRTFRWDKNWIPLKLEIQQYVYDSNGILKRKDNLKVMTDLNDPRRTWIPWASGTGVKLRVDPLDEKMPVIVSGGLKNYKFYILVTVDGENDCNLLFNNGDSEDVESVVYIIRKIQKEAPPENKEDEWQQLELSIRDSEEETSEDTTETGNEDYHDNTI